MNLQNKLAILADAAKYDASCSSSGSAKRNAVGGGMGSTEGAGICHSYTPDGRCISLLKILLTNFCVYDCKYCINRVSSNIPRARFSVAEVVNLTLDFYRRNCIEGLFLSSGIIRSPSYTMEQMVGVARTLRLAHGFKGYIHLKTIPDADAELLAQAGLYADRLSINIELPTVQGLAQLAPEKDSATIHRAMGQLHEHIATSKAERKDATSRAIVSMPQSRRTRPAAPQAFAPGGQSTQMIVGADGADDGDIIVTSSRLYTGYGLRRVYYSAFSPIPDATAELPLIAPPLVREHRLYQADWLMRFYGFEAHEIVPPGARGQRMLSLEHDPKLAWALAHRAQFPVNLNTAPREMLLRVPGLGVGSVDKLLAVRRWRQLRSADIERLRVPQAKVLPFVECQDWSPGRSLDDPLLAAKLVEPMAPKPVQASLF
ncbi:putative DNA modification/repair radical SAM protein [Pantoea sp. 18069]|uniref:putative DNA modification/repair radical SAM protein n=1 Tax=Pantoea sp. 18069 TaxID=2681415 RepID=UPI001356BF4A|nr:putative DNA modification/repair radical SAM protein [Pantoea sp. 18069]